MKTRLLLFILALSGCLRLQAQSYFDSGYYYYYKSDPFPTKGFGYNLPYTNKLTPVWSDAVVHLTDSIRIYSLFKLINTDVLTQYPDSNCTKQDSADALGQQIETAPGYIRLFNQHYEPVTLYTNADTGFLWTCFKNTDYLINAEVIRIHDSIILNRLTKVKTFRLTVFHADSTPFDSNSYNNATISIAEEIGIIECPLINQFPENTGGHQYLTGIISKDCKTNLGITNVKEAEDLYDLGDEFHSHSYSTTSVHGAQDGSESYKILKLLGKFVFIDSVLYSYADIRHIRKWHIYEFHPPHDWDSTYKSIDTGTFVVYSKSKTASELLQFNSDIIYGIVFPLNECFEVVGFERVHKTMERHDSCWYDMFDPTRSINSDIYNGIGSLNEPFSLNRIVFDYDYNQLIYAKKNNCSWGTPYDVAHLGIDEPEKFTSFIAFPNPSNGLVTIQVSQNNLSANQLNVYDSAGRLIEKDNARVIRSEKSSITMDISSLANGLYFLIIESESGKRSSCKINKN